MRMTAVRRFWIAALEPFMTRKTKHKKYGAKWWFGYFRWFFERFKWAGEINENRRRK